MQLHELCETILVERRTAEATSFDGLRAYEAE